VIHNKFTEAFQSSLPNDTAAVGYIIGEIDMSNRSDGHVEVHEGKSK